jgi:hypothetical protein
MPGATTFPVSMARGASWDVDLAYYDGAHGWVIERIAYEVIVGRSSGDADALRARCRVI